MEPTMATQDLPVPETKEPEHTLSVLPSAIAEEVERAALPVALDQSTPLLLPQEVLPPITTMRHVKYEDVEEPNLPEKKKKEKKKAKRRESSSESSSSSKEPRKKKKKKSKKRSPEGTDDESSSSSLNTIGRILSKQSRRELEAQVLASLASKRDARTTRDGVGWLLFTIAGLLCLVAALWVKLSFSSPAASLAPVPTTTSSLEAAFLQSKKPMEAPEESYTMSRLQRNTELRFYVDKSVLAQRLQPLALVKNVTNLVRGYARALSMCSTLSNSLGITGAMQSIPGAETRKLDDLYLSSSSPYGPFFCMNVPISAIVHTSDVRARDEQQLRDVREAGSKMALFPVNADVIDQVARMASQTLHMASISWQHLTTASHMTSLHEIPSRDAIASSSVHSAAAMGYTSKAFFARDLEALGRLEAPESLLQMISYDHLPAVGRLVFGDHQNTIILGTTACVCGLHLGLPRNLAFYFDSQAPHGRITVEAVITQGGHASSGPTPLVTSQGLPWANQLSDERHGVSAAYASLDEELRKAAGLEGNAGFPATSKITIDQMRLHWTGQGHLESHGQRVLRTVEGPEALCIQYCQHLVYVLKSKALEVPAADRNMTRYGGTASP